MKGFLAALRDNWAGFVLVAVIGVLGWYWAAQPEGLEEASKLIDDGKYEEATRLLGAELKGVEGLPKGEQGRLRWLLARLAFKRNQAQGSLTIGDIRDSLALLRQAREDYLKGARRTVPPKLFDDWLAIIDAYREVHGHKEALVRLAEVGRFMGNPPRLLLARAVMERGRPDGDHKAAIKLLDQYLALKLDETQRADGLTEKALTYRSRAEAGEVRLGLNGGLRRTMPFNQLLALSEQISEDYRQEQEVRRQLLAAAKDDPARMEQQFELGRVAYRRARVGARIVRYLRRSGSRTGRLQETLRRQIRAELATARKHLRAYVAKPGAPEEPRAYFLLGESARLLGQYDEALAAFRKLEQLSDQPPVDAIYFSMLGMARVSMEKARWADFERVATQLAGLASGDAANQYELALLFEEYRERRLARMRDELASALLQASKQGKGQAEREQLTRDAEGRMDRFGSTWERAMAEMYAGASASRIRARATEAAIRAMTAFVRLGNTAAAIQACDRFLVVGATDPRISRVLLIKGQQLQQIGLGRAAINAFEENTKRFSKTPYAYESLLAIGDAHVSLGEVSRGLAVYDRIRSDLRFTPTTSIWRRALYREGIGRVYQGLTSTPPAARALERGVALLDEYRRRYPDDPMRRRAVFGRALGLLGLQRWADADKIFARLAEQPVMPGEPDGAERRRIYRLANYLHGVAYLGALQAGGRPASPSQLQTAINILETSIERFDETPQAVWASVQLVSLYHQVGADPQARRVGRRALWLAKKLGKRRDFDPGFWTRWVSWKQGVLVPGGGPQ